MRYIINIKYLIWNIYIKKFNLIKGVEKMNNLAMVNYYGKSDLVVSDKKIIMLKTILSI